MLAITGSVPPASGPTLEVDPGGGVPVLAVFLVNGTWKSTKLCAWETIRCFD